VPYAVIELPRWKLAYTYHRRPVGPGWKRTRFALYDLRGGLYADEDVIDEHRDVARRLIGELLAYRQQQRPYEPSGRAETLELDAEQVRQLKSLGYVEGEYDEVRED
jgi:hypothetical protein